MILKFKAAKVGTVYIRLATIASVYARHDGEVIIESLAGDDANWGVENPIEEVAAMIEAAERQELRDRFAVAAMGGGDLLAVDVYKAADIALKVREEK